MRFAILRSWFSWLHLRGLQRRHGPARAALDAASRADAGAFRRSDGKMVILRA